MCSILCTLFNISRFATAASAVIIYNNNQDIHNVLPLLQVKENLTILDIQATPTKIWRTIYWKEAPEVSYVS